MRSKKEDIIKKIKDIELEIEYKLNEIDNLHHSHDSVLNKPNLFGLGTLFLILGILLGIIAAPFFVEKNTLLAVSIRVRSATPQFPPLQSY